MKDDVAYDVLCAHSGESAAKLVLWFGETWLPAETNPVYAAAIRALRDAGRRPVQAANFRGTGSASAVRQLFRAVLSRADALGATDILTIVSPDDARAYCAIWGFEDLLPDTPDGTWVLARDILGKELQTRLIRLRLDDVPAVRRARL